MISNIWQSCFPPSPSSWKHNFFVSNSMELLLEVYLKFKFSVIWFWIRKTLTYRISYMFIYKFALLDTFALVTEKNIDRH